MPTYDYLCEANGRTVEVSHKMAEQLNTWGELCRRAGIDPGKTAAGTPVRKLIGGAAVHSGRSGGSDMPASCDMGNACCGGVCSTH
jgi:predicted nucleic acid-binding Zn ribbon protein